MSIIKSLAKWITLHAVYCYGTVAVIMVLTQANTWSAPAGILIGNLAWGTHLTRRIFTKRAAARTLNTEHVTQATPANAATVCAEPVGMTASTATLTRPTRTYGTRTTTPIRPDEKQTYRTINDVNDFLADVFNGDAGKGGGETRPTPKPSSRKSKPATQGRDMTDIDMKRWHEQNEAARAKIPVG